MKFDELELDERLLRATKEMGFETTSPIQELAIPHALKGLDLIGQAQTGTGKTAAFGLPMLQQMDPDNRKVQGLVLCPTRELAMQVTEEIRKLSKYLSGIKAIAIYGGQDINRQIKAMKGGVSIVIGTPGRVMDHMRRKTLRLEDLKIITLDEADEMLNMGFREDIETILKETPSERQTLLFSATMPKPILDIARKYQKDAKIIKVVKKELTVDNIRQTYYRIRPQSRTEALCRLLDVYQPTLSIIFRNTKRGTDELVNELQTRGYAAEALHGDLRQQQRDHVMNSFRRGIITILVATDVAARGIDIDNVDAVFNYELPQDDEYYVHRIGRTGRAGRKGLAFSFISGRDFTRLKTIERYCKAKIEPASIPNGKEVTKMRFNKLFENAMTLTESEDLDKIISRLNKKCDEMEVSPVQIAAALVRMKLGYEKHIEIQEETGKPYMTESGLRRSRHPENQGSRRKSRQPGYERLFLNVGKNEHILPGDILGAIAGKANIAGKLIGVIDVHEKFSFVEVPKEMTKKIMNAMDKAKIKGKHVHMEIANK